MNCYFATKNIKGLNENVVTACFFASSWLYVSWKRFLARRLLDYFEKKNNSYVSGLSVCIFVALFVRMCVGANKVEGTMRYYARNQWDFGI